MDRLYLAAITSVGKEMSQYGSWHPRVNLEMQISTSFATRTKDMVSPVSQWSHRRLDPNMSLHYADVSAGKAAALMLTAMVIVALR